MVPEYVVKIEFLVQDELLEYEARHGDGEQHDDGERHDNGGRHVNPDPYPSVPVSHRHNRTNELLRRSFACEVHLHEQPQRVLANEDCD